MWKTEIGLLIKKLRALKRVSQENLATDLGISRRYLSDIENGKRNISLETIEKISAYFKLPVDEFFHLSKNTWKLENSSQYLSKWLEENGYEDTIILECPNYLSAIEGITEEGRLIYDYEKMITHLMLVENMDSEEAAEFIDFNTIRAILYTGEKSPIINIPFSL